MARFFSGGFDVGPPNVRRVGEGSGGGLGSAGNAAAARAIARAIRRYLDGIDEIALDQAVDPATELKRLVPLLKELSERDLYAFPWPQDGMNRDLHGQEGYRLIWTYGFNECFAPAGTFSWAGRPTDPGPGVCITDGPEVGTMAEVSDGFQYKYYKEEGGGILKTGTPFEFYKKVGTPGPAYTDAPMPRAIPPNIRPKVVDGTNPWTVAPGQVPAPISVQIPGRIIIFADELAEQTEPDAEARSRSPGNNITQSRVRTRTDVQVETGAPVVKTPRDTFPAKLPRTKEAKVIGGIKAGSALGRALSSSTESLDIFNVAFRALDAKCKPRGRTSQLTRIQTVVSNPDCIDIDKLIEGLIRNAIEDAVIGKISGAAGKSFSRATGDFRGVGTGIARGLGKINI